MVSTPSSPRSPTKSTSVVLGDLYQRSDVEKLIRCHGSLDCNDAASASSSVGLKLIIDKWSSKGHVKSRVEELEV